jgi:hypothetical protein
MNFPKHNVLSYINGVANGAVFSDGGVEEKLLTAFQRLARYPGVEENDLTTLSATEKELASVLMLPTEEWRLRLGVNVNVDEAKVGWLLATASPRTSLGNSTVA